MIKINKVTTKTGDSGTTLGPGMKKTEKYNCNIDFLGNLDELNCTIGFINLYAKKKLKKIIFEIQHQLFDIGSMFFNENAKDCENFTKYLENEINENNKNLPQLNSFLLPVGKKLSLYLHQARTLARRTERSFWAFYKKEINEKKDIENIGIYLNRLSDLMFVLIRKNNNKKETKWIPLAKRINKI